MKTAKLRDQNPPINDRIITPELVVWPVSDVDVTFLESLVHTRLNQRFWEDREFITPGYPKWNDGGTFWSLFTIQDDEGNEARIGVRVCIDLHSQITIFDGVPFSRHNAHDFVLEQKQKAEEKIGV